MKPTIAIIGMACRYPDAISPLALWENVLTQRRAFRHIPPERLNLSDYLSADRSQPDHTYSDQAALIEGYEFDRVSFSVAGNTFRTADLAHWLALDVATQALADAGFSQGEDLPQDTTGVLLGNTLTGEFSRANTMRLRWPYVRRVVEAALIHEDWSSDQRCEFLKNLEARYKEPFPGISEETLAGNLSNTIAGRICNHFDFKGGAYTVDGACSSSLLAVAHACLALVAGDLDVAIAGGVDLSIDPFELVGFAKVGALASEEMRIYDAHSAGFLPGEGCGFVVLMRYADAIAQSRQVYSVIRGWGISSDGSGGITRPRAEGQYLALHRAYRRANFGIETVTYFEGHGTGTSVGDATELQVLSRARQEALSEASPAVIGSVKANIGHTKAAAGIAGLIKATMTLYNQILPPTTGCEQPHPILTGEKPALQVLRKGQAWPSDLPLRAGVSAMGFGGINVHVVLESTATERRKILTHQEQVLLASQQDAELILVEVEDIDNLRRQVEHLLTLAPRLSNAEVGDLAAELQRNLGSCNTGSIRVAIVAATPKELTSHLETLKSWLEEPMTTRLDTAKGIFLSRGINSPRVGFLFPGQGSPIYLDSGVWCDRFEFVRGLYAQAVLPTVSDGNATVVAQPAIVTASLAGLLMLDKLGVTANIAVGHSLGELTALHWAGALDTAALLRIATVRGKAMTDLGSSTGAMVSIRASQSEVSRLLNGESVVIAGLNSPYQTVISGETNALAAVVAKAAAYGFKTVKLPVSHAFHSPLIAAAAKPLAEHLKSENFQSLNKTIICTVTGEPLSPSEDLRSLLVRQLTTPVQFIKAVNKVVEAVDLLIEVGSGRVLSGLVTEFANVPVVALDAGGCSLRGLLQAVGAAFALGVPVNHKALFADRFTRSFNLDWHPRFFVNPCELAPVTADFRLPILNSALADNTQESEIIKTDVHGLYSKFEPSKLREIEAGQNLTSFIELVRRLVAERAELPVSAVKDNSRLLSDLHLNSITVGQLVAEAARCCKLAPPVAPTDYADATVGAIAQALEELSRTGSSTSADNEKRVPSGVDSWIQTFTVELVELPLPQCQILPSNTGKSWQVFAPDEHPLADSLQKAFDHCSGGGVVICLPPEPDERHINLLLKGVCVVLAETEATRFVLVQHGGGGAAFARTLYLEVPNLTVCVVDVPVDHPQAIEWVLAEVRVADGYSEAHYDASGKRRELVLRFLSIDTESAKVPLKPEDVLLVTGGGKGIAAECALSLARETGVRLALLGRSQPEEDTELAANLDRMTAFGIQVHYISADVTNAEAVRVAVSRVEADLGPITAILHGAGVNVPQLLNSLDEAAFFRTLAPKVQGVRHVLSAINPANLRFLITFGSIIACTGLRGEAHYALANEWLARLIEQFQAQNPNCRCLNVEWSIWSGVGMGERLGRIDVLKRQGITPITPDIGISILRRLVAQSLPATSVVVTGRFGEAQTLKIEQPELPFWRCLENKRVYYPSVELIVDLEVSQDTDPYLNDHIFQGERLFPAVMGLEAIAQVAMALAESAEPPIFEEVKFNRPVVVSGVIPVKIRIAALVKKPGQIEVVLRSEQTAFQVDHFQATCHFTKFVPGKEAIKNSQFPIPDSQSLISLYPTEDIYGNILFHSGRFQRLRGYWKLRATECLAEIAPDNGTNWFTYYLPQTLVLGDPGVRDAAIHALQACIPHATILPVGVDRLIPNTFEKSITYFVSAQERSHVDDKFIYDLQVITADGVVVERWEGLQLQIVNQKVFHNPWVEVLLGPYIERQVQELVPKADVTVIVDRDPSVERHVRSTRAIRQALDSNALIYHRPDGKPEVPGGRAVSASHASDLTLAVSGSEPVGCDIEPVVTRSISAWKDLLDPEWFTLAEFIVQERREDWDTAATRVWAAGECLKKVGAMQQVPLVFMSSAANGWILLSSGSLLIATFVASVRGSENRLVLAVLTRKNCASL